MPWKTINFDQLAKSLGLSAVEIREKHRLIDKIVRVRKAQGLSQVDLAKRVGVSQARIAQVESGIGTNKVTFDTLLRILGTLGFDYKIIPRKVA